MQGVFEEVFGSTGACLRVVREATSTASIGEDGSVDEARLVVDSSGAGVDEEVLQRRGTKAKEEPVGIRGKLRREIGLEVFQSWQ